MHSRRCTRKRRRLSDKWPTAVWCSLRPQNDSTWHTQNRRHMPKVKLCRSFSKLSFYVLHKSLQFRFVFLRHFVQSNLVPHPPPRPLPHTLGDSRHRMGKRVSCHRDPVLWRRYGDLVRKRDSVINLKGKFQFLSIVNQTCMYLCVPLSKCLISIAPSL